MQSTPTKYKHLQWKCSTKSNPSNTLFTCLAPKVISVESYLLPPTKSITMKFVFQFLTGQKKLLKEADTVCLLIPPKMKNFSVKFLWDNKKADLNFCSYFPDYYLNSSPDRNYFFKEISLDTDVGLSQ